MLRGYMSKERLDVYIHKQGFASSRSQAESMIKLGNVLVDSKVVNKSSYLVGHNAKVELIESEQYVSRAALKLKSVATTFNLNFKNKVVLDVGSSTGGFTEFALSRGAKKVIAVDVGTDQMHPKLRQDNRVELHEKTDIRDFKTTHIIDIVLIDVSFISLQLVLPKIKNLSNSSTQIVTMVKPQFEAGQSNLNNGVIKNDSIRRQVLKDFESWAKANFVIIDKADSKVAGAKGNLERFYLLSVSK